MRLEHFQYIVEIAQCKSMSKASKKLFITQPSLSTAIQNLEDELGFQIFKRSASGVSLTDRGELLLQVATEVVASLEKVKAITNEEKELTATVNLSAVPVFCNALMVELIQSIKREYPNVIINIQELRSCKILSSIASGSADIAVGTYSPSSKEQTLQEAAKHGIVIEPVFEDHMMCFLPRSHRLARRDYVTLDDLKDDTPAYFQDHSLMDSYECVQSDPDNALAEQKNYYSFTDRSSIKKMVAKDMAYAILPGLMAYDDIYINAGMIMRVPLADADVQLTHFIAYPARSAMDSATKHLKEQIEALYRNVATITQDYERRHHTPRSGIHNQKLFY